MLIAHDVGPDRGRATVVDYHVECQTYPGRGGPITKTTKGRRLKQASADSNLKAHRR
jgi:hypothetical protein